ncbi:MAG TPA: GntR family transcriptional regulator [Firmicutes bacterium]|nr:GntR family transcriptional regulator [Bacillota bacterium]
MAINQDQPCVLIDRNLPIPLYHQLAKRLEMEIRLRGGKPGELLATEKELQEQYQVSRATVRRAIEELTKKGLLKSISGRGTFIAQPTKEAAIPCLLSFSEELRRQNIQPSTRVIATIMVKADAAVADALHVTQNTNVLKVTRVRYGDGQPLAFTVDYIHPKVGLSTRDDFRNCMFELLTKQAGVVLQEAVHTVRAELMPAKVASYLGVKARSAALRFFRIVYDEAGNPVLYEDAICRGDLYSFSVRLQRAQ